MSARTPSTLKRTPRGVLNLPSKSLNPETTADEIKDKCEADTGIA
jgi:hypothetical protein